MNGVINMKVSEILAKIEDFAPLGLAMNWDNVGLLLGNRNWEVKRALISLDVCPQTVEKAISTGCNLILSHHPLFLRPLKTLTDPLLLSLVQHNIAVISLHTNLDTAKRSVNHLLAEKLGLEVLEKLSPECGAKNYSIFVAVPENFVDKVCNAAWNAGAGKIGNYQHCASSHPVQGCFKPEAGARPFTEISEGVWTAETRLNFACDSFTLSAVLEAIRKAHPYESPALDFFPVENTNPSYGLGLICKYARDYSLSELAEMVKERLNSPQVKLWTAGKSSHTKISRIAICGGSGHSFLAAAEAKAELFITGDISYHSFLESRIPIIDAGHFYTEYPVLEYLEAKMQELGIESSVLPMAEHSYSQGMQVI